MPGQRTWPSQAEELRELRRGTPTLHWVEPKCADADNAAVAAADVAVVADAADKVIVISLKFKAFRSSDVT